MEAEATESSRQETAVAWGRVMAEKLYQQRRNGFRPRGRPISSQSPEQAQYVLTHPCISHHGISIRAEKRAPSPVGLTRNTGLSL